MRTLRALSASRWQGQNSLVRRAPLPGHPVQGRSACHRRLLRVGPPIRDRVAAASSPGPGTDSSTDDEDDHVVNAETEEALQFVRPLLSGVLQSGLVLAVASAMSSSSTAWNLDWPAQVPPVTALCCLPAAFPLFVCLLPHAPEGLETNIKTQECGYNQVGTVTIVLGEEEPPERQRGAEGNPVREGALSSALYAIKTFWTTPWESSASAFRGLVLGRSAVVVSLECLFRGTIVIGLQNMLLNDAANAESGSWYFWLKFFGLTSQNYALTAAGILLTGFFVPVALVYARPYAEFTRFLANKPIRDRAVAALSSAPVSGPELRAAVERIADEAGADSLALSALLSGAQMPLSKAPPRSRINPQRRPPQPPGQPANTNASDSSATTITTTTSTTTTANDIASSEHSPGAPSAHTASSASSTESTDALLTDAALQKVREVRTSATAACDRLSGARSAEDLEASSRALRDASNAMRELSRDGKSAAGRLRQSQKLSGTATEKVYLDKPPIAGDPEEVSEEEFKALQTVKTPVDRLASQLLGAYSVSCMVGINASFLLSGGSLAVSCLTAWVVRVMPLFVFELSRRQQREALLSGAQK
mmetsp:Transcript_27634/g.81819  ORF Transcript_27634/g.81819 Transcript_27634/m.81819 type:complete len:593 (-) Transcript_27634:83-1861(-)